MKGTGSITVDLEQHPVKISVVYDFKTTIGSLVKKIEKVNKAMYEEFKDIKVPTELDITVYDSTFKRTDKIDIEEETVLDELEKITGLNREIIRKVRNAEELYLDKVINEM